MGANISSATGDAIGKAVVEILADDKAYQKGLKKARTDLSSFDKETSAMAKDAAKGFAVAGLAIAGIGIAATRSFLTAAIANEQMMMGLTSVAGSAQAAEAQLAELEETAKLPGLGLPEVVKASINLQAVQIESQKANGYIMEMGNALAIVGRGRGELEGVIRGMQQMTSRGKVLAEEINQISERVPQFRTAMIDAFGTAVSEEIQKLGITVEEFLDKTVAQLAKLPRVAGGAANAIENVADAWLKFRVETGKALLPTLTKVLNKLSDTVDVMNNLSESQKSLVAWGGVGAAAGGTFIAGLAAIGLAAPGISRVVKGIVALGKALPVIVGVPLGVWLAGIGAGFAQFFAGLKLGADQIEKTKDELIGWESVTKAQRSNMAKISEGIEFWEKQLKALNKAQENGVGWMQRLNKRTKEWEDIPIATGIKTVEKNLTSLNSALQIAGGNIFGVKKALDEVSESTDEAAESWDEYLERVNQGKDAYKSYYEAMIGNFNEWTDITGKGFKASSLEQAGWLDDVLKTVDKDSEAWTGLTNKRSELMTDWFGQASFLEAKQTETTTKEAQKRLGADRAFMSKRLGWRAQFFSDAAKLRVEDQGLIKEGFDWEVIQGGLRSIKLTKIRGNQYNEEAKLFDNYLRSISEGELRFRKVQDRLDIEAFESSSRSFQQKIKLEEEQLKEREKLAATFLRNATAQAKEEFDIRRDFQTKEGEDRIKFYEEGLESIEEVFNKFKPFYEKYSLDLVELDEWRADQMLAIEKKLATAKKKEIKDVTKTYEEHVIEAREFWGVGQGFAIPLSGGISPGASADYRERLYGPSPGLAGPAVAPAPASAAGGVTVNITVENLNGGDEGAMNDLAEDIARRIQGLNIQL